MARVKVTRNHQVAIPGDVRKKLGIEEGDYVSIETMGKTLAVIKRVVPIEVYLALGTKKWRR